MAQNIVRTLYAIRPPEGAEPGSIAFVENLAEDHSATVLHLPASEWAALGEPGAIDLKVTSSDDA